MLPKETLNKILEINAPFFKEIDDLVYSDKKMLLIKPPIPNVLQLNTLTGLADYVREGIDKVKDVHFHITDHANVYLEGELDETRQRELYLHANVDLNGFAFNRYLSLEEFIVGFQAQFFDGVDTYPKKEVLAFLGALTAATIEKYIDSGVSQNITIETGISGNETLALPVPNRLRLQPYRTFREIDQPSSEFILRIKKGTEGPMVALFTADGESWKLEAIHRIASWLEEHTEDIPVIA